MKLLKIRATRFVGAARFVGVAGSAVVSERERAGVGVGSPARSVATGVVVLA